MSSSTLSRRAIHSTQALWSTYYRTVTHPGRNLWSIIYRTVTHPGRLSGAPSIGQSPTYAGSLEQPLGFAKLAPASALALRSSPSSPHFPLSLPHGCLRLCPREGIHIHSFASGSVFMAYSHTLQKHALSSLAFVSTL